MPSVTITFRLEKETKGTYRYAEAVEVAGMDPYVGTLYVKKGGPVGDGAATLTVTIAAAD